MPDRFTSDERLLVVNADDFGLTPGICDGILRAHAGGIVTSTTVIAVGPALAGRVEALRSSGLATGGHLTLVGEDPPLLSAAEIPTLVDDRGRLAPSWRTFVRRAALGRVDADDVRRECVAQLDLLQSAGLQLTHLDAHQHLHLWPSVAGVTIDLAVERGIPAIRLTRAHGWAPTSLGVRTLSARLGRRARGAGLVVTDDARGLEGAGHLREPRLVRAIDELGGGGAATVELGTHPGTADDPDRVRYRWGYEWADELAALCSPAARQAVERNGFTLGTYADLAARR